MAPIDFRGKLDRLLYHLRTRTSGQTQSNPSARDLYERYAAAVIYIQVRQPDGSESIGTGFHVGEGVFLTARHVVENNEIIHVANTVRYEVEGPKGNVVRGKRRYQMTYPGSGTVTAGPFYHPEENVDVAALLVTGIECPAIPLGTHLDDWIADDDFAMREVLVMGYPPIPQSNQPRLVASRAEVHTLIDKYTGGHPHFILSTMARGGFSGGPCIIEWDFVLGLVTESLVHDAASPEIGYLAAISVEPLLACLDHHGLTPRVIQDVWET